MNAPALSFGQQLILAAIGPFLAATGAIIAAVIMIIPKLREMKAAKPKVAGKPKTGWREWVFILRRPFGWLGWFQIVVLIAFLVPSGFLIWQVQLSGPMTRADVALIVAEVSTCLVIFTMYCSVVVCLIFASIGLQKWKRIWNSPVGGTPEQAVTETSSTVQKLTP